jgi:hypothetical protein
VDPNDAAGWECCRSTLAGDCQFDPKHLSSVERRRNTAAAFVPARVHLPATAKKQVETMIDVKALIEKLSIRRWRFWCSVQPCHPLRPTSHRKPSGQALK